jgi:hypothetical protein
MSISLVLRAKTTIISFKSETEANPERKPFVQGVRLATLMNSPQRPGIGFRQHQRLRQKQRMALLASGLSVLLVVIVILFQQVTRSTVTKAAVSGDFRSKNSGQWKFKTTWETFTGTAWIDATAAPSAANGTITIRSGHTITVNSAETADQLEVEGGATLDITSNTLTINNGAGTDLLNNGTVTIGSTLSIASSAAVENASLIRNLNTLTAGAGSTITHLNGSEYRHERNGGTIPLCIWNTGSTCRITGVTATTPTQVVQNYHHLIWACTGQTGTATLGSALAVGGNLTLSSTGSGTLIANGNLSVSGDYLQSGGTFVLIPSTTTTPLALNVSGHATLSGGSFDLSASSAKGTWNVSGNLSHTGGMLNESGTGGGEVRFNGTGDQIFTSGGVVNNLIDFTVLPNSRLVMASASTVLSGGGNFNLQPNAGILIRSSSGISSSGASGHVQVSGSRTYSTQAEYIYAGLTNQTAGNGLPSQVKRFECNNPQGVTLNADLTVSNDLTLNQGVVFCGNQLVSVGTDNSNPASLTRTSGHIEGTILRWLPMNTTSIDLPVGFGADYRGVTVRFQQANSTGAVRARFLNGFPGTYGLPITDAGEVCSTIASGWWSILAENGLQTGTFGLDMHGDGFSGITDASTLHLIRRDDATSAWTTAGTHVGSTGTTAQPVISRNDLSQPGEFAVSSGGVNPLPVHLIRLELRAVDGDAVFSWATASEVNSDYFRVERSADGTEFTLLETLEAAGNSTSVRTYSLRDTDPLPGRSYYRLVQVDRDGRTETFGPKALHMSASDETLHTMTIYPNPAVGPVDIRFQSNRNGNLRIQVIDEKGAGVKRIQATAHTGINTITLETSDLKSGKYVVVLDDGTHALRGNLIKP